MGVLSKLSSGMDVLENIKQALFIVYVIYKKEKKRKNKQTKNADSLKTIEFWKTDYFKAHFSCTDFKMIGLVK